MSDRILGKGARLYYSTDGNTYTELTEIVEMGPPKAGKVEQIEATTLNPTNNAKEFLNGLKDTGTFTFKQYVDKSFSRYNTLNGLKGTTLYWRVVGPLVTGLVTAPKIEFQANLSDADLSGFQKNQPVTIDCETQLTGDITITAGS